MIAGSILVVDDDPLSREVVTSCLDGMGYHHLSAASGTEAVPYLDRGDIDLIITDLKMSGLDGLTLAEKALAFDPDRPVILMTAFADLENVRRSISIGVYDFLNKPFHLADLMRIVRRALNHRQLVLQNREYQRNLEQMVEERTRELEKAQRNLLMFKQGIERSGEAIFITDLEGTILYVNPAFERIYGYSREEALGKTPRILKSGKLSQEVYKQFWDSLLAKQVAAGELINKTKDGMLLNIDGSANPILNEGGELVGFLAIQRDITERKRAEEAREAAERELAEQRALSMRSDRLRSLGEMAAGMAHELNQPLVGVRGLAEYLLIGMDRGWDLKDEKLREKLVRIVEQADRMSHIIEHMRMFAREAGKPEFQPVQVNEVIGSAVEMVEAQFRTRGLELRCELGDGLPQVRANPFSLEEVVLNLLINARDAAEERLAGGGQDSSARVVVRTALNAEGGSRQVRVEVIDSGVGIPDEVLPKVFDPFFTTKGPDRGTGLGLSISRSIIEQFGGRMDIQSTPGGGATVTFSLPVEKQP